MQNLMRGSDMIKLWVANVKEEDKTTFWWKLGMFDWLFFATKPR